VSALYRCPRCCVELAGPSGKDRLCGYCNEDVTLEEVGTVDADPDGWEELGRTPEHGELEQGYRVSFENEHRARHAVSLLSLYDEDDVDVEAPLVTGEIYDQRDTPQGPRYEVGLDEPYWYDELPETVWVDHWEIEDVLERTKASARIADIREGLNS